MPPELIDRYLEIRGNLATDTLQILAVTLTDSFGRGYWMLCLTRNRCSHFPKAASLCATHYAWLFLDIGSSSLI
jgi:hypothetical protein